MVATNTGEKEEQETLDIKRTTRYRKVMKSSNLQRPLH